RVAANKAGARKLVLEIASERIRVIAHEDRAHAALALRDQNRSERAFTDGETNVRLGTAGTKAGRRHAQNLIRFLVETAVGVVTRAVNRVGHRLTATELSSNPFGTMRCRVRPRRHPRARLD